MPEDGELDFCGATLLCPKSNFILRNVAIAPEASRHGTILVAIIWQSRSFCENRSELYIYDVPESIYYEPCNAYNGSVISSGTTGTTTELANHRTVQGKRVISLDHRMGGIHSQSPLWDLVESETAKQRYHKLNKLGGLQLHCTTANLDDYPHDVQSQKSFVWGPTHIGGDTLIDCMIFDLSFADPQRLRIMTCQKSRVPLRRLPDLSSYIGCNQSHCACSLHDEGFRIVLPSIADHRETLEEAEETLNTSMRSSFWLWKSKAVPKLDISVGSITRKDSLARLEALARRQEWFKDRIRCMKRAGLSNVEIQDMWSYCKWTRYGRVWKPVGWKTLV